MLDPQILTGMCLYRCPERQEELGRWWGMEDECIALLSCCEEPKDPYWKQVRYLFLQMWGLKVRNWRGFAEGWCCF